MKIIQGLALIIISRLIGAAAIPNTDSGDLVLLTLESLVLLTLESLAAVEGVENSSGIINKEITHGGSPDIIDNFTPGLVPNFIPGIHISDVTPNIPSTNSVDSFIPQANRISTGMIQVNTENAQVNPTSETVNASIKKGPKFRFAVGLFGDADAHKKSDAMLFECTNDECKKGKVKKALLAIKGKIFG